MDAAAGLQPGQTLSPEFRTEKWGPFSVIGAGVDCTYGDNSAIGPLWGEFFSKYSKPENSTGVYGVFYGTGPGTFHYMAAYAVPHGTKVPEGLEQKTFPGTKFAIWDFCGTPAQMSQAFGEIYQQRLAAAGLEPQPGGVCLEVYPPNPMDESNGTLRAALHVAVK